MSTETSLLLLWLVLIQEALLTTPTIKVTPQPVIEGGDMTLTCNTSLNPPRHNAQLQVTYYKEGRIVQESGVSETYRAYNVQLEDSGKYSCAVETTDGRVRKKSAEKVIQIVALLTTPTIKVTPHPVIEGGDMTLTCNTSLHPSRHNTQLQVTFYKERRIAQRSGVSDIYKVYNVQLGHSGKYSCEVETTDGKIRRRSAEQVIQIEELFSPPVLTVSPESVSDGDNMTLSCDTNLRDYRQNTDLQYAFYRDGGNLQGFTSSNKYKVQFIQEKNSGYYTCEIQTSTHRVKKQSQKLQIQGKAGGSVEAVCSSLCREQARANADSKASHSSGSNFVLTQAEYLRCKLLCHTRNMGYSNLNIFQLAFFGGGIIVGAILVFCFINRTKTKRHFSSIMTSWATRSNRTIRTVT
ncbi:Fc receptor-like protein 6 [Dendropsophus ebraccatus]|uniref:Fc receptor-like protein 6 n=1 Tax=Dendropsophus ebraccatus TaxID=150705 RepID=UPI003831B059